MDPSIESGKEIVLTPTVVVEPVKRHTRFQLALAFGVAGFSDLVSHFVTFAPPFELALDMATAFVLFLILGRRWPLLPGLVAEAIPGLGLFPIWILVVLSIGLYDGIKRPRKS